MCVYEKSRGTVQYSTVATAARTLSTQEQSTNVHRTPPAPFLGGLGTVVGRAPLFTYCTVPCVCSTNDERCAYGCRHWLSHSCSHFLIILLHSLVQ